MTTIVRRRQARLAPPGRRQALVARDLALELAEQSLDLHCLRHRRGDHQPLEHILIREHAILQAPAHQLHHMRVLAHAAGGIGPVGLADLRHVSEALLALRVDVDHAPGGFEKLRQPRGVVADVVDQPRIQRRRRAMAFLEQPLVQYVAVRHRGALDAVFAGHLIPFLAVVRRLDQRIGVIAQRALIIGVFEGGCGNRMRLQ